MAGIQFPGQKTCASWIIEKIQVIGGFSRGWGLCKQAIMLSVRGCEHAPLCVPVLDGFRRGGSSEFGHEDPYYVKEEHEINLLKKRTF